MTTKSKLPPPPPANGKGNGNGQAQAEQPSADRFAIISGRVDKPQRVTLYGPGGIGKSTLASLAPEPVFIDIENGTGELDVPRVEGIETYADLRACLQSGALDGFGTIVLDSATKAEELAVAHVLENVPHEKNKPIRNLEDYGFGKGMGHVYDAFLLLLADMDRHVRCGRHVILIAHNCISDAPNPYGEDYIRYEPNLQTTKKGRSSIRNRVIQWSEHVLFLGYDVDSQDGKGKGGGTRTIHTSEFPSHLAKSRRAVATAPFTGPEDGAIWTQVLGGQS